MRANKHLHTVNALMYLNFTQQLFVPSDAMLALYNFYAVAVVLCLSVQRRHCVERGGLIELNQSWRLRSAYPTLCCKKIRVSSKITVDLANFTNQSRYRQSRLLTELATVESSRRDTRSLLHVRQPKRSTTQIPLLRFVVDLPYNLFL